MSENICSICNEKFEDEYFDKEQNKCILHCEKYDSINIDNLNTIFINCFIDFINNHNNRTYKEEELKFFIEREYIILKNIIFPNDNSFLLILELFKKNIIFEECKFYNNSFLHINSNNQEKIFNFKEIIFRNCKFLEIDYFSRVSTYSNNIYFNHFNCENLSFIKMEENDINLFIENSTFEVLSLSEVSFSLNKVIVKRNCFFNYIRAKDKLKTITIKNSNLLKEKIIILGEFELLNIIDSTIEECLKLNDLNIISLNIQNSELRKGIELNNTLIKEKVSFFDTKMRSEKKEENDFKLNLSNTNLPSIKNFLNLDTEIKNRETARIIKDSFEQQNNIIEANKFYAIEMKKREEELTQDLKEGKNFFEWLVFKIHGASSNHSQDWLLALFWIILFGFAFSLIKFYIVTENNKYIHFNLLSFLGIFLLVLYGIWLDFISKKETEIKSFFLLFYLYLVYVYETKDIYLIYFTSVINPFNKFSNMTLIDLLSKIIIAYLIYQLIISIRQNTRRK